MDTLRWILLVLGLLIIGGLYGFYRWQEGRNAKGARVARRRGGRRDRRSDRDVDDALRDLDDLVIDDPDDDLDALSVSPLDDEPAPVARRERKRSPAEEWDADKARADGILSPPRVRHRAAPVESEPSPAEPDLPEWAQAPEQPRPAEVMPEPDPPEPRVAQRDSVIPRPAPRQPMQRDFIAEETLDEDDEAIYQDAGEKIVVLHVTAGEGYCFTGPAVMETARKVGLTFGEQQIFHRYPGGDRRRTPLFGMASMVKPGVFDPQRIDSLETPGLAMFLQLPAPFDGLSAFEEMLETARRIADELDGHVLDGRRCDLTQQAVEHLREELREYRRRAHLAAKRGKVH